MARKPNKANQKRQIAAAVSKLQAELIGKGFDPGAALAFSRLALGKAQGVSVGKGGSVHFKGKAYSIADFAKTPFVDYVTGVTAKKQNQAALESDPVYQQTLANLGLQRDQSLAQLGDERRNALIDFGDPSFVTGDPTLAAAVKANPFSTSNLQAEANRRNVSNVTQNANQSNTIFGGGLLSGQREAQRQYAADSASALTAFTRFLGQNNAQQTNLNQQYDLGQRNALLQAQQALTAAGLLNASVPPVLRSGGYKWFRPDAPTGSGGPRGNPPRGGSGHPPGTGGPPHGGGGHGIPNPPPPIGHPISNPGHQIGPPRPPLTRRILPSPSAPWNPNQWHRRWAPKPPPPRGR